MSDTQDTGIGTERWHLENHNERVDKKVDGTDGQSLLPTDFEKGQHQRNDFEGRIAELERKLADYTKKLRDALDLLFARERSRNDNLLMAYARLKTS